MSISFCLGDKSCYESCKCIIEDDDMETLMDKMDNADILVIAAPSYWADVPGQFKVFIDRCTPYSNTNPNLAHRSLKPGKKCYAVALRTGASPMECEHIIGTIEHWCGHMGIAMADSMYFCSIEDKDDIVIQKEYISERSKKWFA